MNELTLREAIDQTGLQRVRSLLRNYKGRNNQVIPSWLWEELTVLKEKSVSTGDQLTAKAIWCLEAVGHIQDHFVTIFVQLKAGEFQKGWNELDNCEQQIVGLDKHFTEDKDEFGVEHARVHTKQFQDLYPLHWGVSPGMLYKEIRCSTCDTKLALRSGCEHINGEIYDGKMCHAVVTSAEFLHLALVENPVQKFSFIFPEPGNDSGFQPIKELATRIGTPWRRWSYYKEERRQFHPRFKGIGRNARCPCNSGTKYKYW